MELQVVVFILFWLQAVSKVYWTVSNKPVMYGDNIILTCKTEHILTDTAECPVRQWHGGYKNKLLLYNNVSRNVTKYEDITNLLSTEFSLVIKNYTESDLNINYTCSCGFKLKSYTNRLGLNDNNFIVPPLRVNTTIQQFNDTLSIYVHVERVYLRPECYVVIGERTVFDKLTLTSVKRGMFYYGTCKVSLKIFDDDCGKKPTLLCYIGNEHSIVNTSGEPIRNFTVPPLRVDTYIQQSNEALSIYLHVERVYPRPVCSIAIGERTIFNNLTLTSVKCDVFYNATFEASINIVADDCGKKPTLLCYIGNEYSIVNASGEPIRNCKGVSDGSSDVSDYLVLLYVLLFYDCSVLSILYRKSTKIRNHFYFDDLISRNCWDWRRTVVAIALTVIAISIDICTKYYTMKYLVNEANGDDIATRVGLCVSSLLLPIVLSSLISTSDMDSIREGFRVAVSRFEIKKMTAIPCKEYREVSLEKKNVNSSSGTYDNLQTLVCEEKSSKNMQHLSISNENLKIKVYNEHNNIGVEKIV